MFKKENNLLNKKKYTNCYTNGIRKDMNNTCNVVFAKEN